MDSLDILKELGSENGKLYIGRLIVSNPGQRILGVIIFLSSWGLIVAITDNNCTIILGPLLLTALWFIFRIYYYYFHTPKNDLNKKGEPIKIGIIIAIDDKGEPEGFKLKSDFLDCLNKNLPIDFKIIELPQRLIKKLLNIEKCYGSVNCRKDEDKKKELEFILKENTNIKGHYRIYGNVKRERDGTDKYFIETNAVVLHNNISDAIKGELEMDFQNIFPKEIDFDENYYKSGYKFSGQYNAIVAKYMIGVALLISGNPFKAWDLHKNLYGDLLGIEKKENINAKFNEKYARSLASKIKLIQYNELRSITEYFYDTNNLKQWKKTLDEWYSLGLSYNCKCVGLFLQKAIYEFLVNKNIKESKFFVKKAADLGSKESKYSLVFLELYDKKYALAKQHMKGILKKKWEGENTTVNGVLGFIDKVLEQEPEHFEFLYWQGLLYLKKLDNISMADIKMTQYINQKTGNSLFELYPAEDVISEIKSTIGY